jgi:hypothetical protein
MGAKNVREQAIIPMTPAETHVGKEGYFVKNSSGSATLCTAVTDIPIGVILDGEATTGKSSVQVCDGAGPTVRVKLGAAATAFAYGTLHATDGTVCDDPGSGNRVRVCRFLESGVTDELVEAVLIYPLALS